MLYLLSSGEFFLNGYLHTRNTNRHLSQLCYCFKDAWLWTHRNNLDASVNFLNELVQVWKVWCKTLLQILMILIMMQMGLNMLDTETVG
jgi:hypothetical protein